MYTNMYIKRKRKRERERQIFSLCLHFPNRIDKCCNTSPERLQDLFWRCSRLTSHGPVQPGLIRLAPCTEWPRGLFQAALFYGYITDVSIPLPLHSTSSAPASLIKLVSNSLYHKLMATASVLSTQRLSWVGGCGSSLCARRCTGVPHIQSSK